MKNRNLNKMIKVSLLSTIGFLLMFIEVGIPIFPNFLKIDISDLPALIAAFAFGPVEGIVVELIKNILHAIFKGSTVFVGEFANFAVGSILVVVSGYIYKKKKTRKNAIISLISGVIVMSVGASILNYYILLPMYSKAFHAPLDVFVGMGAAVNPHITSLKSLVVWAILPFNLIKGVVVGSITALVYKSVSPILHSEQAYSQKVEEFNN